ncbi:MAG: hypothetical protein JWM91_19 [Rhodospirillales bacterium]|nr:hypothetical protein [Rhodospirillales bacterium]
MGQPGGAGGHRAAFFLIFMTGLTGFPQERSIALFAA